MKKKIIMTFYATLLIAGLSNLHIHTASGAEITTPTPTAEVGLTPTPDPTVTLVPTPDPSATLTPAPEPTVTAVPTPAPIVTSLMIERLPSKTVYSRGESLDLSDMNVLAYYDNGTLNYIVDYTIVGYNSQQIGPQTVAIVYGNQMTSLQVTVLPAKVSNLKVSAYDTTSYTLTWDYNPNAIRYEIYSLNNLTGGYDFVNTAFTNSITFQYPSATVNSYMIYAVENVLGVEYKSVSSDAITAATSPEAVTGLIVTSTATNSISLAWDVVPGASGYLIYRSAAGAEKYVLTGSSDTNSYISSKLNSGSSYQYKVYAYVYNESFVGQVSNIVDTSTNPSKMVLKYKQGDEMVRFTWSKITGATSYDIYVGSQLNGYSLVTTITNPNTLTYIAEGFTTGEIYSFYAVAQRDYNGMIFSSPSSDMISIEMQEIAATSTAGKYFTTLAKFQNSYAFKQIAYFKKYVNYGKSFVIPGLITTNIGGFSSTSMCPQGLTFAEDYLLVSAYDMKAEENSVIYVLDKATKDLLTTLILPSKPHAGGLAYDGYNIWVTNGSKVSSISFSEVETAVEGELEYYYVSFNSVCKLNITTSFTTYYDGKLWVGTYNELEATNMYSYQIDNIDTVPTLTQIDTIVMPTRVQGVAFSKLGTLFISRSCQLYKGLRGYMRQIDVYKPLYSSAVNGVISLGELVNSVSMPSMNEGIAIDKGYLYVNFESAAFDKASYKMDRICAFNLNDIAKKK